MLIARTRQELNVAVETLRRGGATLTLVPTMGGLHAGHLSLVTHALAGGGRAMASIFVNPLQFGQADDLLRYPRDEAGDIEKLAAGGCHAVWLPSHEAMYPAGDTTFVDVGGPAIGWEGEMRPAHFRGVATVIAKLFGQIRPDAACFGEKDFQQLQVIRRITRDLSLGVHIIGVETLRETDGLALSTRNQFLTQDERARAPHLHAVLQQVAEALRSGLAAGTVLRHALSELSASGLPADYLALVDSETMMQLATLQPGARLIAAVRLGSVRLLDNVKV